MGKVKRSASILYFTYLQIAILVLFAFVTTFTLTRLAEVQISLEQLTTDTVPTVIDTAKVNQGVEQLIFLTVSMSNATSQASRRIISQQLEEAFIELRTTMQIHNNQNRFLVTQIGALEQELVELEELVDQRLKLEVRLQKESTAFFNQANTLYHSTSNNNVKTYVTDILFLTANIQQYKRIHQLRTLEKTLIDTFDAITDSGHSSSALSDIQLLQTMLIGKSGIVNQKVESLRVTGRTIGRGNFVKNLAKDIVNNLNLSTKFIYLELQQDAKRTDSRIKQQTQLALAAGGFTLLLTLVMIYVLHRRIVYRLIRLNSQVDLAATKNIEKIRIDGKDEIAELANTFTIYLQRVKAQEQALVNMSLTDPLTNIPNRRAFDQKVNAEIASASRQSWPLTLLLIDIDHFKKYNDTYGHSEGDNCLKSVANTLNEMIVRSTDLCARYGGEEFVCVLPNTNSEGAKVIAERIRKAIENLKIEHKESPHEHITISIGVATFGFNRNKVWSLDRMVEQTDVALYDAKAAGRNCFIQIEVE